MEVNEAKTTCLNIFSEYVVCHECLATKRKTTCKTRTKKVTASDAFTYSLLNLPGQ